jgi:hypothetical protein
MDADEGGGASKDLGLGGSRSWIPRKTISLCQVNLRQRVLPVRTTKMTAKIISMISGAHRILYGG